MGDNPRNAAQKDTEPRQRWCGFFRWGPSNADPSLDTAVAALLAVVLKGLIAHSIIVQLELHKRWASAYCLLYMFTPLLTFTLTSSIWKGSLTVGFPDINSVWVISFIAQRALEHRITEKLKNRQPVGYSESYEFSFLTTEWGVMFSSYMIEQMWLFCLTLPPHPGWIPVQLLCYCAAVALRFFHLYSKGNRKNSVSDKDQSVWHEICLRHYLCGFRLQLVGNSTSDTKAICKSIQTLVYHTLVYVLSCIILCMGRCAHQNMPPLAIVTQCYCCCSWHSSVCAGVGPTRCCHKKMVSHTTSRHGRCFLVKIRAWN